MSDVDQLADLGRYEYGWHDPDAAGAWRRKLAARLF